jgi:HSP20 family protein
MNVIHYTDPWRLIDRLHREANRVLAAGAANGETAARSDWLPAVDIREEDERFVFEADLPGVALADLDITVEKGVLTLSGSRATRPQDEAGELRRAERASGRFLRRFSLPESADPESVQADYRNGVLTVAVAKRPPARPRKIEVN